MRLASRLFCLQISATVINSIFYYTEDWNVCITRPLDTGNVTET